MDILYTISHTSSLQRNNSLCLLVWKDFLNFNQSETRIAHDDHVFVQLGWNEEILEDCQITLYLAKRFQRRILETDQPETRIAYGGNVC
jgi:hypothetical protein